MITYQTPVFKHQDPDNLTINLVITTSKQKGLGTHCHLHDRIAVTLPDVNGKGPSDSARHGCLIP